MDTPETSAKDSEGHGKHHEFVIFIDAIRYTITQSSMTGAQLKALAGKDAQYQLYLEVQGDHPDKLIADDESVAIKNDMHFYALPPATFGHERNRG
jgi:multiubiquitin